MSLELMGTVCAIAIYFICSANEKENIKTREKIEDLKDKLNSR